MIFLKRTKSHIKVIDAVYYHFLFKFPFILINFKPNISTLNFPLSDAIKKHLKAKILNTKPFVLQ